MNPLDIKFNCRFEDEITIRGYLQLLLESFWIKGESFDSKRPFGDSDYRYDLYLPLIDNGFIAGRIEDGFVVEINEEAADLYILGLIGQMCQDSDRIADAGKPIDALGKGST